MGTGFASNKKEEFNPYNFGSCHADVTTCCVFLLMSATSKHTEESSGFRVGGYVNPTEDRTSVVLCAVIQAKVNTCNKLPVKSQCLFFYL